MSFFQRTVFAAGCATLAASVACGGSPTAPSTSGATISGTISGGVAASFATASAGPTAATAPSTLTVTVVGTTISTTVDASGAFHLDGVPSGNVQLLFSDGTTTATIVLSNVGSQELIQILITISGNTVTIVSEERTSGKVALCHRADSRSYHLIEVSVNAEPAHRAHGDGAVGDPVPADPTKVFDSGCRPVGASVEIEKSTNGEDADVAPGPSIPIGAPVTWRYLVTNTGTVNLANVAVTDDRGVVVSCGGQTTIAAGQSMTCTGTGVAVASQYRNVGTVTADFSGGHVTAADASHYLGVSPVAEDGPKVQLCHKTGNGSYHLIEVGASAEPDHRSHGDAKVGEAVPGSPGRSFNASCSVQ